MGRKKKTNRYSDPQSSSFGPNVSPCEPANQRSSESPASLPISEEAALHAQGTPEPQSTALTPPHTNSEHDTPSDDTLATTQNLPTEIPQEKSLKSTIPVRWDLMGWAAVAVGAIGLSVLGTTSWVLTCSLLVSVCLVLAFSTPKACCPLWENTRMWKSCRALEIKPHDLGPCHTKVDRPLNDTPSSAPSPTEKTI